MWSEGGAWLWLLCAAVVLCPMSKMAHIKSTAKPLQAEGSGPAVSFEFGLSRVCESDLKTFAKHGWLDRKLARPCMGETEPKPEGDEVVVFKEFFLAGFRFPAHPLVIGVLKCFKLRFHQLNHSSFTKLSIYVWACRSQGVEPSVDRFIKTHMVHTQPRSIPVAGSKSVSGQFGVYTFCYRMGVEVPT